MSVSGGTQVALSGVGRNHTGTINISAGQQTLDITCIVPTQTGIPQKTQSFIVYSDTSVPSITLTTPDTDICNLATFSVIRL